MVLKSAWTNFPWIRHIEVGYSHPAFIQVAYMYLLHLVECITYLSDPVCNKVISAGAVWPDGVRLFAGMEEWGVLVTQLML